MKPADAQKWQTTFAYLDTLYRGRMKEWQALQNAYDLDFDKRFRDLKPKELVRISIMYPRVRQIIAAVAYHYPKIYFSIEDEDAGSDQAEVLERASAAFLRIINAKSTVWQIIFDTLFCSVGWGALDFNRSDDALFDPTVNLTGANAVDNPDQADLVTLVRRPPGHVHVDPLCGPQSLGGQAGAGFIRELKWIETDWILNDDRTKAHLKKEIKSHGAEENDELAMGEVYRPNSGEADELQAKKEALSVGDFTLCSIVHDRRKRMRYLFVPGIEQPVQEEDHPFARRVFEQVTDGFGNLQFEEDGLTPMVDVERSAPAPGWLVTHGFPLKAMRFDLHGSSFYPKPHLEYIKDLEAVVVESMSRQSVLMKRTARQGVIARSEVAKRPGIVKEIQNGEDNQYHVMDDINNIKELSHPSMPPEQYSLEDRALAHIEKISSVADFSGPQGPVRSATADSLEAAADSVNRDWMDIHVGGFYEEVARDGLTIMADPRYKPENFEINVAPQGAEKVVRALDAADFMWNYSIEVQAGSMSPLVEELEKRGYREFYELAIQSPNFDRMELDKGLAQSHRIHDIDKYLRDDINEDARQAAALILDRIMTQPENGIEGLVTEGLDHRAHLETYQQYQQHPIYQHLVQQAQGPFDSAVQAQQQKAAIDQMVSGLIQQHQALLQQEQIGGGGERRGSGTPGNIQTPADVLQSEVQSNAQNISNAVRADATERVNI